MKNMKFKILLTNIRRVIMSFLFINLSDFLKNNVNGSDVTCYEIGPTCYDVAIVNTIDVKVSTWDKIINYCQENVFILIVPIVLVILLIVFVIKKIKENKKITEEAKRRMEEKNDK